MKKIKIAVLASGGGTDFQSIIDACDSGKISGNVSLLICDNCDAFCMKRAEKHKITSFFINPSGKDKKTIDNEINSILQEHNIDLIVGAGYMRILTPSFVKKWYGKLINIHPSILPIFKGTSAQGDAFDYGVKITGCTTHFIDEHMDHGPIILQAAVKVMPDDNKDSLAERILEVEHQILPRTIDLFAQGRLKIKGRKVKITKGDSWADKYKIIPNVLYSEGY